MLSYMTLFFILVRASAIDIRTMFVPMNIVIALYITSIWSMFSHKEYLSSIIGFVLTMSILSILSFLFRSKVTEEITLKNPSSNPEKRLLLVSLFIVMGVALSFYSAALSGIYFTSLFVALLLKSIRKNLIMRICFLFGITFSFILLGLSIKTFALVSAALLITSLLEKLLKKFDDTEKLIKEEKEIMAQGGDVYGAIGFGDILILGALAIGFGYNGMFSILFFSGIFHIILSLIYSLYAGNGDKHLPFIPGITLAVLYQISEIDVFMIKAIFEGIFS